MCVGWESPDGAAAEPVVVAVRPSSDNGSGHLISPPAIAIALRRLLPGIGLCAAISLAAVGLAVPEAYVFGRAWIEPLVLAILIGTAIRTGWTPPDRLNPGIAFAGRTLLEVAVALLGASLSAPAVLAAGPWLIGGIGIVVVIALAVGFGIGRAVGLPARMATLVACGNAICGNSAIAAVAPVIGAGPWDIASSIAFTAVLGVVVVLALPLLAPVLGLSGMQYGVVAGLTVYAVPQVLAATAPFGSVAVQIGMLVKLVRVLMLGPVVLALSLWMGRGAGRVAFGQLVPWFILAFLAMAGLRAGGLIPPGVVDAIGRAASGLTILSMAALGLGVDARVVARAGAGVVATVVVSLIVLLGCALVLVGLLHVG